DRQLILVLLSLQGDRSEIMTRRGRQPTTGPLPAELVQAAVLDAEGWAPPMGAGPPSRPYPFGLTVADGADRLPVDDDPIRQHPGVVRRAPGQRNTAEEPEQTRRPGA